MSWPTTERIRSLFKAASETGDWQYRVVAWLELAGICPCYRCYEEAPC